MPSSKPAIKTQPPKPEQLRPRVIFTRTTVALHDAAKEVAASLRVSLSLLAVEALSRLVEHHNPAKPRTVVVELTDVLHDAATDAAARLNLPLNEFLEDALLRHVELHTPTRGTTNDENETTARQETGQETEGEGRR